MPVSRPYQLNLAGLRLHRDSEFFTLKPRNSLHGKALFPFIPVGSHTFLKPLNLEQNPYKSQGAATKKETSRPQQPCLETQLWSTFTQEWGQDAGLDLMLAGKHENMETLANRKTTGKNQSPLERVPALLE